MASRHHEGRGTRTRDGIDQRNNLRNTSRSYESHTSMSGEATSRPQEAKETVDRHDGIVGVCISSCHYVHGSNDTIHTQRAWLQARGAELWPPQVQRQSTWTMDREGWPKTRTAGRWVCGMTPHAKFVDDAEPESASLPQLPHVCSMNPNNTQSLFDSPLCSSSIEWPR